MTTTISYKWLLTIDSPWISIEGAFFWCIRLLNKIVNIIDFVRRMLNLNSVDSLLINKNIVKVKISNSLETI